MFGIEEDAKPELPAPPTPADRAEREAPRTIPRPGSPAAPPSCATADKSVPEPA